MACCGELGPTGSRVSSGFPTPPRRSVIFRWRPPQAVAPWSGIRDATAFGNRCAQLASTNGAQSLTEDCLFLNAQRPAGANPRSRLQVFVFIHGGGYVNGSSDQHDGTALARQGRIITVTAGSLRPAVGRSTTGSVCSARSRTHALTAEGPGDSGNYGFLDQQASLRWVQHRIADFGGDRTRVTIGGPSSSAQQICSHLSAPGSLGLFSAAIIESGSGYFAQPLAEAEQAGSAIAASVGCPDGGDVPACLRSRPTEALAIRPTGSRSSRPEPRPCRPIPGRTSSRATSPGCRC